MQHDDIIEITTLPKRRITNQLPIRRIYEYEETIEVLIATNSKPETTQEDYTISIE